jgi:uncharacterized protein (TIGR03435 family)
MLMRAFAPMGAFTRISFAAFVSSAAFGQSTGTAPAFDIADVHASASGTNPFSLVSGGFLRDGRYDLRKATMLDLIRIAYGADADKVVGGPSWLEFDRFDISAKAPPSTPPETVDLMLQSLLADRFKLVLHKDTKPLPAFALTMGNGKPKLKEAGRSGDAGCQSQPQPGSASYSAVACRNITMEAFAQSLRGIASDYLRNPVVDSTGLKGSWDFDLKWNPRSRIPQAGVERITIFDAINEQLGLALEPREIPTPVLVVDRVNEKPTGNPPGVAQALPPRALEFEVAEIKLSPPEEQELYKLYPSGRLEMRAFPMKDLISQAWDIDWIHIDERLAGAPKWIDSKRFDIFAKTSAAPDGPRGTGFMDDDLRLMLRALLVDRFKMSTHYEDRPVPAYVLTAVSPKLRKADASNRANCKEAGVVAHDPRDINPRRSRLIQCQNITMAQFAQLLQSLDPGNFPNNGVTDATGIKGSYDFTVSYSPQSLLQSGGGGGDAGQQPAVGVPTPSDPNGALSFVDAVSKQLGLKLEMRKRMLPVLVVDHMKDKPADN